LTFDSLIKQRPDLSEEMNERVGIIQFDGGLDREQAESATVELMRSRHILFTQGDLFKGRGV